MKILSCQLLLPLLILSSEPVFAGASIQVIENKNSVTLLKKNKPILRYLKQPSPEAKKHSPYYSRTGYIHPLYSPNGKIITGDYAVDHPHQHGLFFAWTKSSFRGDKTEFWNQHKKLGDIRFHRFLGKVEDMDSLSLKFEQVFTTGKDSDESIIRETWTIKVPKKEQPYFQFDLISSQACATKDPLVIEVNHYGGMAVRGNDQWLKLDKQEKPLGQMLTSDGKNRENGNHSRPRWVAMYGPVDGEICGVVIMNHPDNFRFPQWVRLHPSKPYFVFAPMVEKSFVIQPGMPYISKFRVLLYDGTPDHGVIGGSWKEWIKN